MTANAPAGTGKDRFDEETAGWKDIVRKYQQPSKRKGAWQLVNTLGPYIGLWVGMYFAMSVSWWLVIPMAILAGGFLVRTFIIFHDCTHGSFFRSKRANEITGIITGFLVFTPFHIWRWEHTVHHASAGDLDRRGIGDVWTLTVKEYLESSRWRRFAYRLSRNPIVLFLIAPLTLFLIIQRFPVPKAGKREQLWLLYTNIALLAFVVGLALVYGLIPYLIIQLTVMGFATTAGVWLFYVQHQFEDAYWERRPDWDYAKAALEGSSFYKLPKILQWFSGNIGYHHIHHLSPRIPNYHLERAHNSEPMFRNIKPLTVRTSIKSLNYRLWDEDRQKLIGYKGLKALPSRKA